MRVSIPTADVERALRVVTAAAETQDPYYTLKSVWKAIRARMDSNGWFSMDASSGANNNTELVLPGFSNYRLVFTLGVNINVQ